MSQPLRHHYVPVFYLKPWTGEDGRLCEFSTPHRILRAKRKHPSATGYVDGLYTVPGLPPEDAQFVERDFMKAVDNWAAQAARVFLKHNSAEVSLTRSQQVGWARFLYAAMLRTPEQIFNMAVQAKTKYQYDSPVQQLLPEFINSVAVIQALTEMSFHTIKLDNTKHTLLTSDRPIVMTEGIKVPDAYLMIPISPQILFMAVREKKTAEKYVAMPPNKLVEAMNDRVCSQSRKFVYGVDDSQYRFVQNRFGKMERSSPLDN